jgi:AcrR family transcriptional regulator
MAAADPSSPEKSSFPRLNSGPRQMPADRVAEHQRRRLEGAMIEIVARHGYSGTSVREVVALAGVSKSAFYEHFKSKEDCFLATLDRTVLAASDLVANAYNDSGDFRERMRSALLSFMELVVARPAVASFAAVESLTLGTAGVAHRERASERFEFAVRESFRNSGAERELPDRTVVAIVNGIAGILYRRLRAGRQKELPDLVDVLLDWSFGYARADTPAVEAAVAAAELPCQVPTPTDDPDKLGWDEPPDSARSKSELSQRDRIIRAAALVVVERGYESLSIPAISRAAGTSNQTFYEHFATKREAFMAAFDVLAAEALGFGLAAFQAAGDSPAAVGAGLRGLTEHVAGNRAFARLAFFEVPAAGPAALDRADEIMDAIVAFLNPPLAPSGVGEPIPVAVGEAIGAGIWAVIQREIANDQGDRLPKLAPELTRIALMPLQ